MKSVLSVEIYSNIITTQKISKRPSASTMKVRDIADLDQNVSAGILKQSFKAGKITGTVSNN